MSAATPLVFGESRATRVLLEETRRLARVPDPLLIVGEPGTGKTLLARYIHGLSGRPGPFLSESVSGIPPQMEAATLRGHSRGAFTGAVGDQMGLLESANGGTLFLDELGNASRELQGLLLRTIENPIVRRLGESRERPIDVRFIMATNADLGRMAADGCFRTDLIQRFGYFVLRVPSLAQRGEDVLPLAECFIARYAARLNLPRPALSEEVRDAFLLAPWTGNVRELEKVCSYAVVFSVGQGPIERTHLPSEFLAALPDSAVGRRRPVTKQEVLAALAEAGGNKTAAARQLDRSRQHLHRMLKEIKRDAG